MLEKFKELNNQPTRPVMFLLFFCLLSSTALCQEPVLELTAKVNQYVPVKLTADLSKLSTNQKKMLPFLFQAAEIMDRCFWYQAYGDRDALLASVSNPDATQFDY